MLRIEYPKYLVVDEDIPKEDKVQGEEDVEQGQDTPEEKLREDNTKKLQPTGSGTTAPRAVLPLGGTTARTTTANREFYGSSRDTTSRTTALLPRATESFTVVATVLPHRDTTAPITVLPSCLRAETGLRPLYPSLDPLRL